MSHVNVTINGRQYRMACEEGQETRLLRLAEMLESRVTDLRGKFGEIGDQRLTVMASLTIADELQDAERRREGRRPEGRGQRPGDPQEDRRAGVVRHIAGRRAGLGVGGLGIGSSSIGIG